METKQKTLDTHLCVGGPLDGKRYAPPRPGMEEFNAAVDPGVPAADLVPGSTRPVDCKYVTYVKRRFHTPDATFTLWAQQGLSYARVMQMLLEAYEND